MKEKFKDQFAEIKRKYYVTEILTNKAPSDKKLK